MGVPNHCLTRINCEASPVKEGSKDERVDEGRKELPGAENAGVLR